jgi:hypothetical protein
VLRDRQARCGGCAMDLIVLGLTALFFLLTVALIEYSYPERF